MRTHQESCAKYRANNIEKIKEYQTKHYAKNSEKIKERQAKYNANNAEKIKERQAEKVDCVCGSIVTKCHIKRHERSKKHIACIDN